MVVIAKWSDKALDEGFVPFPKRLLRSARALFRGKSRMSDLCAMLAIVDYERPGMSRKASLEYLAFLAGLSKKRFRSCLEGFEKRGWVSTCGPESELTINYDGFVNSLVGETEEKETRK